MLSGLFLSVGVCFMCNDAVVGVNKIAYVSALFGSSV